MANKVEWGFKSPVVIATSNDGKGRWFLKVQVGEVLLKGGVGADRRRVVRDVHGAYCIAHGNRLYKLCNADAVEVAALRDLFGDWTDPAWVRRSRGEIVPERRKRTETLGCPDVLTGAPGEVESVQQWPMTDGQLFINEHKGIIGATDCLIHFDKIRVGGTYNSRRPRIHDGMAYVTVRGRCVPLGGALLEQVQATATRVYDVNAYSKEQAQRVQEEQAALADERYDAQNVHDDETKC